MVDGCVPWSLSWGRADGDAPVFIPHYGGPRPPGPDGPGRNRTRCAPTKGHSWRTRHGHCPRRGFACQIPVKEDQEAARRRRGGEGGREYSSGPASCTKRTVVERAFASYKQWRAPATRHGRTRPRPHSRPPHPDNPHPAH